MGSLNVPIMVRGKPSVVREHILILSLLIPDECKHVVVLAPFLIIDLSNIP